MTHKHESCTISSKRVSKLNLYIIKLVLKKKLRERKLELAYIVFINPKKSVSFIKKELCHGCECNFPVLIKYIYLILLC